MTFTRIRKLWDSLTSSYWFVPLILIVAALLAAKILTAIDRGRLLADLPTWLDAGQPESARVVLSTIASSTITIASLTFSITIVALTLASGQFGSRLLYNFMRSRVNQFVLGAFVGIYVYCTMVLQSIRSGTEDLFVPHLAVTVALGFAVTGSAILIFFIHHIAKSIQVTSVITAVRTDLCKSIERFFPERTAGDDAPTPRLQDTKKTADVRAICSGIVQAIDIAGLAKLANEHDVRIHLRRRPGDYVIEGAVLAELHGTGTLPASAACDMQALFVFGSRRTLIQDVEFAMLQLVEIAVRALSPGINDPFTACSCLDELGSGIASIMLRSSIATTVQDKDGVVRVVVDTTTFEGIVNAAFNQIRQHGQGDVAVVIKILDVLRELCLLADRDEHFAALQSQAQATFQAALQGDHHERDREEIRTRYERVIAVCDAAA
tara:strand:- start:1097 stop:2404 length:1308 start_codon:yes stop_codon:yes gene_type:complete